MVYLTHILAWYWPSSSFTDHILQRIVSVIDLFKEQAFLLHWSTQLFSSCYCLISWMSLFIFVNLSSSHSLAIVVLWAFVCWSFILVCLLYIWDMQKRLSNSLCLLTYQFIWLFILLKGSWRYHPKPNNELCSVFILPWGLLTSFAPLPLLEM